MSLQQWAGAQRLTLALVFTDIVGSTRLANRMGDEQWIQLIIRHTQKAREIMRRFDCCEIKMIGDAFMVAFRTADDALDFAFAFQTDTGDRAIKIRAGIHVGAVYLVDDDLYGKTVNYASRVVASTTADWIVLSDNAKSDLDLTRARSRHSAILRATDLGANLKGFSTPSRLWRALTQGTDKVEKAKAEALNQPAPRLVPTRPSSISLSPRPNRENTAAQSPPRNPFLSRLLSPPPAKLESESSPDWFKLLLTQADPPSGGENPLANLLRGEADKKKKL